jgi:hypothetical protein
MSVLSTRVAIQRQLQAITRAVERGNDLDTIALHGVLMQLGAVAEAVRAELQRRAECEREMVRR